MRRINHKDTKTQRPDISLCLCVFVGYFLQLSQCYFEDLSDMVDEDEVHLFLDLFGEFFEIFAVCDG